MSDLLKTQCHCELINLNDYLSKIFLFHSTFMDILDSIHRLNKYHVNLQKKRYKESYKSTINWVAKNKIST